MCFNKRTYESERAAKGAAKKASLSNRIPFRFYLCPICTLWHITKSPKKPVAEIIAPKCPVLKKKIQYDTEKEAKTAKPDGGRFLCRFCGKWHTTVVVKKPEQWMTTFDYEKKNRLAIE